MSDMNKFSALDEKEFKKYQEEAKERWGDTDAWKQSQERTKHWTKADYKRIAEEGVKWTQKFADLKASGKSVESPEVQEMISQHYAGLRTFYEPNYEMYKGLGQMYVDDPRFTAYYDKFGEGLAVFLRDAMHYYVDVHSDK